MKMLSQIKQKKKELKKEIRQLKWVGIFSAFLGCLFGYVFTWLWFWPYLACTIGTLLLIKAKYKLLAQYNKMEIETKYYVLFLSNDHSQFL